MTTVQISEVAKTFATVSVKILVFCFKRMSCLCEGKTVAAVVVSKSKYWHVVM